MPPRLKSLELHGYKTFAAHTLFEFAEKVTAIVGPNGSGKSNIADSIRWVLGEQSYTLLRGKKTEDMIFSGSEQRPRAGMASATIVFDNGDGWLPIDFSEVAITRRAYRDGENEYLLNGQRVRLKDVSELLAQSGLAERTYTIIGQGLVDAALALKAEERRRLFEEAAGIGLHRSRREESLRRLDTTRRNLDRVQDILAELQPRLRSLERQARRANEYELIKTDLQVLLREWYGYHWRLAQHELAEAREAARSREGTLERVRSDQLVLSEKLEISRSQIQELRTRLNAWHRESSLYHSQREAISRDLAVSEERARALVEQEKNAQEELRRIEEEMSFHQERLDNANREAVRLRTELEESRSEAAASRQALSDRQVQRRKAEDAAGAARQEQSNLTARQSHLSARQAERKLQSSRREEAMASARKAVESSAQEVQAAQNRLHEAEAAYKQAAGVRQKAEEAVAVHSQKQVEAERARRQALEAHAAGSAEAARLKAQLDVLDQAEETLAGYQNGAKVLIQEARKKGHAGTRGALSSVLDVPSELETAIAAALGEYLDAVIFEQESGLDQALQVLESASSRAAMLPLDALHLTDRSADGKGGFEPGDVIGQASSLVNSPAEY
jgi:chromosome segregation protein